MNKGFDQRSKPFNFKSYCTRITQPYPTPLTRHRPSRLRARLSALCITTSTVYVPSVHLQLHLSSPRRACAALELGLAGDLALGALR